MLFDRTDSRRSACATFKHLGAPRGETINLYYDKILDTVDKKPHFEATFAKTSNLNQNLLLDGTPSWACVNFK